MLFVVRGARRVPFVVIGSTLFAFLPGMEFAPLAAAQTGATTAQIQAAQEALVPWFLPVLMTGAFASAIGVFGFEPKAERRRRCRRTNTTLDLRAWEPTASMEPPGLTSRIGLD